MPYIVRDLSALLGIRDWVGDKECVALVQQWAGAPHGAISSWRQGAKVLGNTHIARGTAIATFVSGHYDGHAAIYLGETADGIQVFDQWRTQRPHERTIYSHGRHSFVDTANNYYVIE
ncbi:MAG: BPSL0067 family protein [Minicystis sp.]